jgi:putative toxin-antitoxin system antitoxin component (TIGR02293 family)
MGTTKYMVTKTVDTPKRIWEELNNFELVEKVRKGVKYNDFMTVTLLLPFTMDEWSVLLHLSLRTIQRIKQTKKTFAPAQTERILEIAQVYNKGIEVFESADNFGVWLNTKNIALGGVKPKTLLDTSFGVEMVKDELGRIEYGVLA